MSRSGTGAGALAAAGLISRRLPDAKARGSVLNLTAGGSTALAPSHGMGSAATRGRKARKAERPVGDMAVPSALLVAPNNGFGTRVREGAAAERAFAHVPTDVATLVMVGGPQLVRAMVADLIDSQPGMRVERSFASVAELDQHCRSAALRCHVTLLDIDDCRGECAETIDRLLAIGLPSKLVLLASETTDEIVLCASSRRVDGVILKESSVAELYGAIAHIRTGHSVMPARWRAVPDTVALTPRHVDVLELVAQGFSNEEIAAQLGLRPNTVKFHISEIFRRLGVRNRIEAIAHVDRDGALAG
jgi:DNA-binding NarL/FixJ family response regulator